MDENIYNELRDAVREIVLRVPPGRITTYGAIARASGFTRNSRLVGKIMSQAFAPGEVPAHRVVSAGGKLSAAPFFGPTGELEKLLKAEGILSSNGRIKHFKKHFWEPLEEL